jgi:hypothetical protein
MSNILDYGKFNENNSNHIRVSCAGLASIKIGKKYLLVQNKNSRENGVLVYGPLGGAIEWLPEAQDYLNDFVIKYERKTPDLRFITKEFSIGKFSKWFYERKEREISCKREIVEELVSEEKILKRLNDSNIYEEFRGIERDRSIKSEMDGEVMTERFFEIFDVSFDEWTTNFLTEWAQRDETTIGLFTKEEILNDGMVTNHSKFIL